jgi:hypothetical protein
VDDDVSAGRRGARQRGHDGRFSGQRGVLSLEAVFVLPILALLVLGLVETASLLRDVLVVHDAARAGARAAATSTGSDEVTAEARGTAPGLRLAVSVTPERRAVGDLVSVTVTTERRIGPVTHRVRATAVARVEPIVSVSARAPRSVALAASRSVAEPRA